MVGKCNLCNLRMQAKVTMLCGNIGYMSKGRFMRTLRESKKLTQEQLAKLVGVSRVSVSKWESGENNPRGEHLSSLASALGVEVEQLLMGDWESSASNVVKSSAGARRVPVLSYVQAGKLTELKEIRDLDGGFECVLADDDLGISSFAMRLIGDSMLPDFAEGDLVIIDPDIDPVAGDYVAAKNGGGEATFKKFRPRGHNNHGVEYFELVPLNEDYAPIRSDMSPVSIIGVMVEHRKYRRRRK